MPRTKKKTKSNKNENTVTDDLDLKVSVILHKFNVIINICLAGKEMQ